MNRLVQEVISILRNNYIPEDDYSTANLAIQQ